MSLLPPPFPPPHPAYTLHILHFHHVINILSLQLHVYNLFTTLPYPPPFIPPLSLLPLDFSLDPPPYFHSSALFHSSSLIFTPPPLFSLLPYFHTSALFSLLRLIFTPSPLFHSSPLSLFPPQKLSLFPCSIPPLLNLFIISLMQFPFSVLLSTQFDS